MRVNHVGKPEVPISVHEEVRRDAEPMRFGAGKLTQNYSANHFDARDRGISIRRPDFDVDAKLRQASVHLGHNRLDTTARRRKARRYHCDMQRQLPNGRLAIAVLCRLSTSVSCRLLHPQAITVAKTLAAAGMWFCLKDDSPASNPLWDTRNYATVKTDPLWEVPCLSQADRVKEPRPTTLLT